MSGSTIFKLLFVFSVCFLIPLNGQVASGTVTVSVQDSAGAVVPGASISVTNRDTGLARTGTSNERGEFGIPFLPAGEYTLSVSAAGFKRTTIARVPLQVDQTAIVPVTLEIGEVREIVEVSALTPLLDAETSSLGQVIENKKILDLPLNGRNPFALGLLAGNTMPVFGMGTNQPFVAGGGRFSANDILLDGADNNTTVGGTAIGRNGIAITPSVDAVQEFKVKTNSFSAEFGHAAGAIVSATIKSGSNSYHGTLYEFLRNDRLDANNFITNLAGLRKAKFRQNQFGGSVGGRIIRNKTFFFTDVELMRQRTAAGDSISSVPTAAIRSGDLSSLNSPIFDPAQRRIGPNGTVISVPFANARIPESRISPTASAILALVPLPNFGAPGVLSRNYFTQIPRGTNNKQYDIRIDHNLLSNNNLFVRYSLADSSRPNPGQFPSFIGTGSKDVDFRKQAVLSDTHVVSPRVVNEFRFAYTRNNSSSYPDFVDEGVQFSREKGIALFPFPAPTFPNVSFRYTTSSGGNIGAEQFNSWGGGSPNLNFENRFQWADTISISRDRHNFKVGADIRRARYDNLRGGSGVLTFGQIFSSSSDAPGSGAPFADFLFGNPAQREGTQMLDWGRQRDAYFGFFFQDDWKVGTRLTLNLGIRYELFTQPVDARDLGSLFDVVKKEWALPGKDGYTRAIVDGDHNNFGPRAGFAYHWKPKWVFRGGYGIFYGLRDQNQQVTQFAGNNPNTPAIVSQNITAAGTVTAPYSFSTSIVANPDSGKLSSFTPEAPLARTVRSQGLHDARFPWLHQVNFSIQFQPRESWVLETSFSGAYGRDLATLFININQVPFEYALDGRNIQRNRPVPNINGTVIPIFSTATNNYNAFNARLEKRFSRGLSFLLNYSIQKNLESGGSGPSSFTQNGTSIALDTYNLAREKSVPPIDIPQVLVFSFGYELPFLKGTTPVRKILGNWQINGISYMRSGFPTDIRTSLLPPVFNTFNLPDRVVGESVQIQEGRDPDRFFNPAAFRVPGTVRSAAGASIQTFGNSGRRIARGPGSVNLDFSLFKDVALTERLRLQFRTEAFNLTNTPTFLLPSATSPTLTCIGTPGSACNSNNPQFGKLSGSTSVGRQVQFGMKLIF